MSRVESREPYRVSVEEGKARRLWVTVLDEAFRSRYVLECVRFSFLGNSSAIVTDYTHVIRWANTLPLSHTHKPSIPRLVPSVFSCYSESL